MGAPQLLMYGLDGKKSSRLRLICIKLNIRAKLVPPSEFAEPVGAAAGFFPISGEAHKAEPFPEEMLVMVEFGAKLLNSFLQELRAAHLPPIPLKAVLTPSNMEWSAYRLRDELVREHQSFQKK